VSAVHLLLIHQAFALPGEAGGTRHYELGQAWLARGHEFTVVRSGRSYLSGERVPEAVWPGPEAESGGLKLRPAYAPPGHHRSFVWRAVSYFVFAVSSSWLALRVRGVDLVQGTSPPLGQALSAWLVAALKRRPFLLEVRDLWPDFAVALGVLRGRWLIRPARWLERFVYARARHVVINSPAYADHLRQQGVPADRITVIANGVDPTRFDPEATGAAVRERQGLIGKFVVVYAGAIGPANDLDTLLEAARQLHDQQDIHWVILGDGKERPRLEALARSARLGNVTFAGPRPKAEMKDWLAAADACVATLRNIPMFRTTYPNKVFDYMAAGRPTVLAIDGAIRTVIESAAGGLCVPPGDATRLAEAVRRLQAEPELAKRLGQNARRYVCAHFDRRQQAESFIRLALTLAGRSATAVA
jgi:glycosyltransferase involved in cell wall biosynthesis